jgi:HEAT repeat protein
MWIHALMLASVAVPAIQAPAGADLRVLPAGSLSTQQGQLLERLKTEPLPQWLSTADLLASKANTGVASALMDLADESSEEVRRRAGFVLAKLGTLETLGAALALALEDESAEVREFVASALYAGGVPAQLGKAKLIERVKEGLTDKDEDARFTFAMILARVGDPAGKPVLKKLLAHKDHHRRESAAEALAELGDDSGAAVLVKMLEYTDKNHPLLVANKESMQDPEARAGLLEMVNDERVRVCGHVGKLKVERARRALQKLSTSENAAVAEAASKALAALAEG